MNTETISQAISQARQTPNQDDDALSRIVATSFSPAGSQYSPAGVLFPEDPVMRFERLTRETMELRMAGYRRLLHEQKERAEFLERQLAEEYSNSRRAWLVAAVVSMLAWGGVFWVVTR